MKTNTIWKLAVLMLVFWCSNQIQAQNNPIQRMGTEDTSNFDNDWLFVRYGFQPDGLRKEEPTHLEDENIKDNDWQKLNLPHDWAITGPFRSELTGETGKLPWKAIGWYRKYFEVPTSDQGKQIYLDFDGAMANAKVWLNGKYLGTWPFGYNSFRMNLTPHLKFGQKNVIAVRLDTENWDSRWYPGGGIYRHVWMVKTNALQVAHWGTYITTPKVSAENAHINLAVTLQNNNQSNMQASVYSDIYEMDLNNKPTKKVAQTNTESITVAPFINHTVNTFANIQNPKMWDIETPNRYVAITNVVVNGKVIEKYFTPFGVRTIEFSAQNGFQLNGRKVKIQGTCNHHDLGALGAAINTKALQRQLTMLKEMGCNSLRTSHNPPAPELLELADKMGFLVWDEAFDAWKNGKKKNDYNKIYDNWHEKDLIALVHRDRNHPSVFIWSIGNEVMDQRNVEMTKHLADIMRNEDPTRPVSNGYNDPDGGREVGAVVALDIMGVNYFFDQQPRWDADPRYKDKPTIGSETSSCVSSRGEYYFGNPYKDWHISSYDVAAPDWGCAPDVQFRTNAKYPNLLGEYVWTGFDYLGEPTPYNSDETNLLNFRNDPSKKAELEKKLEEIRKTKAPSRSSYFGIIDLAGFKKDRFYLYQSQWKPDLPMAHILPHWNWKNRMDSITPVHIYTSGDEAELFLNGKSLGRKTKIKDQDFRLVWENVTYQPGKLEVVAYKNGKKWASDMVQTSGEAAKLKLETENNTILSDDKDLAFITLKILDKNNIFVPNANHEIQFEIKGDAEIVATDNGNQISFESFQSPTKKAFNGLALAIVKAKKGAKGTFKVIAKCNGLSSDEISIKIK